MMIVDLITYKPTILFYEVDSFSGFITFHCIF